MQIEVFCWDEVRILKLERLGITRIGDFTFENSPMLVFTLDRGCASLRFINFPQSVVCVKTDLSYANFGENRRN